MGVEVEVRGVGGAGGERTVEGEAAMSLGDRCAKYSMMVELHPGFFVVCAKTAMPRLYATDSA